MVTASEAREADAYRDCSNRLLLARELSKRTHMFLIQVWNSSRVLLHAATARISASAVSTPAENSKPLSHEKSFRGSVAESLVSVDGRLAYRSSPPNVCQVNNVQIRSSKASRNPVL